MSKRPTKSNNLDGLEAELGIASLTEMIRAFVRRYMHLPSEHHELVFATWVIHTWMIDAADVTPYLWIYSADPGSGKTRLLDLASILCFNAERGDDMTAPVMFKLIGRNKNNITLLIDEIDTIWKGSSNEWKRRTINTGYKRGGSAWREEARELVEFSTFCPKALAGLDNGFFPETIKDRAIPFPLVKKPKGVKIERFKEGDIRKSHEYQAITDRIMAFREDCYPDVIATRPQPLGALGDRQNEIVEPLLVIAQVLGVATEMREALSTIFQENGGTAETPTARMLNKIRTAFNGEPKMWSRDLTAALGNGHTGRSLAMFLAPMGVEPTDVRIGNKIAKGYQARDFEDLWDAYCEPQLEVEDDEFDVVREA